MALLTWVITLAALIISDAYRLPTTVNTESYNINLLFPSDVFTTESATAYTGNSEITFYPTENITTVVLHASTDFLNVTSITLTSNLTNSSVINNTFIRNTTTDLLTIQLNETLVQSQKYVLSLDFVGKVSVNDMYGAYKSSYSEGNVTYYFVTTQFEATYARRAFPCFDEPSFKATFALTVTYPNDLNALFNTQESNTTSSTNTTTTIFNPSPKMSSYLVAFIVSKFTCSSGISIEDTLINQVCSRNETESNRAWALEVTPRIVDSINAYTGINYSTSLSKLHQVAIPDFAAGAMENWGLITYRERALLYDDNETSNSYKQYIAAVIAHELAHQWFGNLVTCKWWSEIFLNEGFATLLEHFITHEVLPDYEMDKQFITKTLQYIFEEDASTSESLRDSATTPAEISTRFGGITYDKGGSVLRMVETFLGSIVWKNGLNTYLNTYGSSSAEPNDLWNTIYLNVTSSSLPANLSTIMNSWINSPGYPVLDVSLNGTVVTVNQKRFVFNNSLATNVSWYVPITYTTSNNTTTFSDTTPSLWLTPDTSQSFNLASNNSWVVLNNLQSGYYRVNYDSILWSRLSSALKAPNFSDIPEINRAQIINDAFNLARAGSITYHQLFNITEFLVNETSYHVWYSAFSGFGYLLKRLGKNSTLGQSISNHIKNLSSTLINSVPLSEVNASNHIYTLSQVQAQSWACKLGNTNCTSTASELFRLYANSLDRPNKNLRSIVYCYGLKNSNNISSDWEFLWNAFLSTSLSTEQVTILATLGCSSDENILKGYLNKTLNDGSGIRSQDYASVFAGVYQNSDIGVDVALDFYINNFEAILQRYTSMNAAGNLLKQIAELTTTENQLNKIKNFINSGSPNGTILEAANLAQKSAENNLAWAGTYQNDLFNYYGLTEESSTSSSSSTTSITTSNSTSSTTTSSSTTSTSTITTTTARTTTPSKAASTGFMGSIFIIFTCLLFKF